jgi:hypothetical protein
MGRSLSSAETYILRGLIVWEQALENRRLTITITAEGAVADTMSKLDKAGIVRVKSVDWDATRESFRITLSVSDYLACLEYLSQIVNITILNDGTIRNESGAVLTEEDLDA